MRVEIRPALKMEQMFETAVALAEQGRTTRGGIPKPLDLALFTREFDDEVRAAFPPRWVQRAALAPLAWLASRRGRRRAVTVLRIRADAGSLRTAPEPRMRDAQLAHTPRRPMATSPTEEPLMDTRHEEPRNLAEELDLPEQLDDDEAAAPAGGPLRFARMTGSSIAAVTPPRG